MSAAAFTLVTELIAATEQAATAYARIRALAVQVGATEEQLAQADARFAHRVADPLAGVSPFPPPPPPPPDPTLVEYDTKDEAIARIIPGYPIVVEKTNGKFIVYPQIGPLPGVQVYPEIGG